MPVKRLSRRRFAGLMVTAPALVRAPRTAFGAAPLRIVVIGGGAAGATTARLLAREGGDRLDITLVERDTRYTSCFQSNLYLGGYRPLSALTHDYQRLARTDGIDIVHAMATRIDRDRQAVHLADGRQLSYDRLVVSPGIDLVYDSVPGYSESAAELAPHAWQDAVQLQRLKSRLDALQNGENVVIVAPPNPYRCPPGPYERASMIARQFRRRGLTDSRVTIIDAKRSFSKQALFEAGWRRHYPDVIEWFPSDVHGGILSIDAAAGTVETDLDTFRGALLNVIPAQRAGTIAQQAALTDASGFCPIDPATMRSSVDSAISVLGDACVAGDMPKSAFAAHSQARVAAAALLRELLGRPIAPPRFGNICWSLIDDDDAIKVGGSYAPSGDRIESIGSFISQPSDASGTRASNYTESIAWYESITSDMFGNGA